MHQSYFEENKQSWNKRTAVHKDSAFYDLDSFKKGKSSLNRIELEELGDVTGKSLLHLQCHFGMDTMSWAKAGADCVGVDLSDEAINLAKEINAELNLQTEFLCCNVYDLKQHLDKKFDIVFTSYGTIGWLPDLDAWAAIIAHFLKPGGIFYIADFHPVLWMMDEKFEQVKYDYFNTEIINALLKHKLQIAQFNEFPYTPYNCFNNLEKGTDGMWRIKDMDEKMPMMYSIKAVKQA